MASQDCVPGNTTYRVVSGGKNVTVEYCLTRGDSIGLAVSCKSFLPLCFTADRHPSADC